MDHQFVPSCDNISNDIQNDSNENSVAKNLKFFMVPLVNTLDIDK